MVFLHHLFGEESKIFLKFQIQNHNYVVKAPEPYAGYFRVENIFQSVIMQHTLRLCWYVCLSFEMKRQYCVHEKVFKFRKTKMKFFHYYF